MATGDETLARAPGLDGGGESAVGSSRPVTDSLREAIHSYSSKQQSTCPAAVVLCCLLAAFVSPLRWQRRKSSAPVTIHHCETKPTAPVVGADELYTLTPWSVKKESCTKAMAALRRVSGKGQAVHPP